MKKIALILVSCILWTNKGIGQNINKLDEKNGFKEFTLGDNISKWTNYIKFDGNWNDGTKAYVYTGGCCNKVFDYDVENIVLRFNGSTLVSIVITLKQFQERYEISGKYTNWRSNDFESLKNSFAILFGPPSDLDKNDKTGSVVYSWVGKKVVLFSQYEYLGVTAGDRQKIIIGDLTFLNNDIQNGF